MQPRSVALWAALALSVAWVGAGGAQAEGRVRVAVLPVVVHTVDDHHYLRDGLSDMLAARLARNGSVAVVRVEDPARATTRPEEARAVARELGADYALFGSFTRFGDGASLDLQCLKVAGDAEPRAIFIQSGSLGQIIPRVDQLADKVVRYVSGEFPVAQSPNGTPEAGDATEAASAADVREALDQLQVVYERLEALEAAVYERQQEEVSESVEGDGDTTPGPELSSARGEAPPLP